MLDTTALTLCEYLDLPAGTESPADPTAADRLRAAIDTWRRVQPDLPRTLPEHSAAHLCELVAGRGPRPGHAAADPLRWLAEALAVDHGDTADTARLTGWQRSLCRIVAPLVDHARAQASAEVPAELRTAVLTWLATPPIGVVRLLTGAFVLDMQAARAVAGVNGNADDDWFDRHLSAVCADAASRREFFARYPLLARLASTRIRYWRDAAVEFATRLWTDLPDIAALLGSATATLLDVTPGLGDPHRGGRAVARVDFAEGSVAYKPRPLRAMRALREFTDLLADRYGVRAEIFLPDVLDRGEYGWVRWIETRACADETELRRYYRRLGELQALAWLLGANDLHSENILAAGDRPYLVDAETLLTAIPAHAAAGHRHPGAGILLESPVSTGILPGATEREHSAFGQTTGQLSGEVDTWDAAGTGAMRLVRRSLPQPSPNSAPTGPGEGPVDPFEYTVDFLAGNEGVLSALAPVGVALAADDAVAKIWHGVRTRAVLRDTADYARVAEALCHPAILHNPFLAEGALQGLLDRPPRSRPDHDRAVLAAERAALLRGDVPYFEVPVAGGALHTCAGTVLAGYYDVAPIGRLRDRARRVAHEQTGLRWATRAALRCGAMNRTRTMSRTCCADHTDAAERPGVLRAAAAAIGRRISDLAYDDGTELGWLTLSTRGQDRWRVVAADNSLYLGVPGVLLFLDTLCRQTTVDDRVRHTRQALLAQWLRHEPDTRHGAGVLDGLAGDLYVAMCLARHDRVATTVELLADTDVTGLDLFSGAAGVLLVLCQVVRRRELDQPTRARALAAAHRCARRVLDGAIRAGDTVTWPALDGTASPLVGFAHGSSGIAHALLTYRPLAPPGVAADCAATVLGAHRWESELFDRAEGNWPDLRPVADGGFSASWCNGAAGIGMARAAALRDPRPVVPRAHLSTDLDAAIAAGLRDGLGLGQALCHGDLGVAELLLVADRLTTARRIGAMVATDVLAQHGCVTQEFGTGVDLPGLVNGAAGVGYQMLRLADPGSVPSVLLLECRS